MMINLETIPFSEVPIGGVAFDKYGWIVQKRYEDEFVVKFKVIGYSENHVNRILNDVHPAPNKRAIESRLSLIGATGISATDATSWQVTYTGIIMQG